MLKIYRRLWQVNWAEQWQYRANLLMYLAYWLVSPVVYLAVWISVANSQGNVQGLTANDFVTYYLTLLIVNQLTSDITIYLLAYKIQDGTLASDLLKPVHPVLTSTLVNNLAFKALMFTVLIPVWVVLAALFRPDYSAVTAASLLRAAPALALATGIRFLFGATITCLAFWTTRVYSLMEFYSAVELLFAGQFVPLVLMPRAIQSVAGYLPFQFFMYFPIEVILNRAPPETILPHYALEVAWLGIALGLFFLVWGHGLKRFSAVGA
jgi:ABC-2 type transport system permease protein